MTCSNNQICCMFLHEGHSSCFKRTPAIMVQLIPSCSIILLLIIVTYWAFKKICFASIALCKIWNCVSVHHNAFRFLHRTISDFWKRLTSYSNAGVEAMPDLLWYHSTLDKSYCDQANIIVYITLFLVKDRLCQVLQHVTKQSGTIHSPMGAQLTTVFGSVPWRPFWVFRHASFKLFNKNGCQLWSWKFHVLQTSCKVRILIEG